jgi:hypothetical protein
MADPITWKNVEQSPYGAYIAGGLLKGAGDSFASGIDQLKGVYNDYQKGRSQENTAAYEAELAKYTTPEALKAAQDSGVFARLGSEYGIQMDPNVLKNGVRNTQTNLVGDVTAAQGYADHLTQQKLDPLTASLPRKLEKERLQVLADAALVSQRATTASQQTTLFNRGITKDNLAIDAAVPVAAELKRSTAEILQDRAHDAAMQVAAQEHMTNTDDLQVKVGTDLKALGLPVTSNGRPDSAKIALNPEFAKIYTEYQRLNPDAFGSTDTAAHYSYIDKALANGTLDARGAARLRLKGETFNTTKTLSGSDAIELAVKTATLEEKAKLAKEGNSLIISNQYPLEAEVGDLVNSAFPKDPEAQRIANQEINKWRAAGGITLPSVDGKPGIVVPLSLPLLKSAMSASTSWGDGFNYTFLRNSLKSEVQQLANSPTYQKQIKSLQEFNPEQVANQLRLLRLNQKTKSGVN